MATTLYRALDDLRRRMTCDDCGEEGRPLLRVYGMPAVDLDWQRLEREGRCVFVGCCVGEGDPDYQCRHCGSAVYVEKPPESLLADGARSQ